jgi:hypothetical protein
MTNISLSADQAAMRFTRWTRKAPMYMKTRRSLTVSDMYGMSFRERKEIDYG